MISINKEQSGKRAVGLLSGGLDSTLAAKLIKDQGYEVHGIYFSMPWGCCNKGMAQQAADKLGIKFVVLQLDERYLEIVKNPKHGYGTALNPCVDCRVHMFNRAAQYMKHIDADFVFTGEVLGQRPMSQRRHSMNCIERRTGLEGRLLRPLSAKMMEPTIVEKEGKVDRNRLLEFTGRGRKPQIELAEKLGITDYPNPAGGCLLTDRNFAERMKDVFEHGYRNFRETVALQWGRHFRIDKNVKFILGRDKDENLALISYAHPDDIIMQLEDNLGPTLVLKTNSLNEVLLQKAGGFIQLFSKYKNKNPKKMIYWKKSETTNKKEIIAAKVTEDAAAKFKL